MEKDIPVKLIKLNSIDEKGIGHFKDSLGQEYTNDPFGHNFFYDIAPYNDLLQARKLFLNKTLWLNNEALHTGDPLDPSGPTFPKMRFEPVTITDIFPSVYYDTPLIFMVKTKKAEVGFLYVSVSGTNSKLDPKDKFDEFFLLKTLS